MQRNSNALDHELDEALEMTFPASDPVAMAAPGSTSRKVDGPPRRGESKPRERRAKSGERRKR